MGEHTGPLTVYRAPRRRWHEVLLASRNTLGFYVVTLLGLLIARLLLAVSLVGAAAAGAVIATLWIAVWTARLAADRVQITDRYRWDRARRAGIAVVGHLPATGLLPVTEVRALVRRELSEILDLLVEQDRLLAMQRDARRAAAELPAGEPVRRGLGAEPIELDERLRGLISLADARVARLARLAAQATELATLEARRSSLPTVSRLSSRR